MEEGKAEWQIVGVVDDVRMRSATDPPQPEIFVSYRQLNAGVRMSDPILVVRTRDQPTAIVPTVRALVREQDPRIALDGISTMEQRLMGNLARPRLYAILLGGFAAFALVIAAVGLFGVLSYTVAQRSREIAVRSALGAQPGDNMRLVLRQGLSVAVAGLVVGLGAAAAMTKAMSGFLYGVTRFDAVTYAVVPLVLLGVATVACLVPAWRAARLDPLKVLKGA
jgi:ABC-type antimicrobial peptide transport system permease subunit